jgi:hypothetical protein
MKGNYLFLAVLLASAIALSWDHRRWETPCDFAYSSMDSGPALHTE